MTPTSPPADPRWQALVDRRTSADGEFFYGVRTTGICCRPSCSSRRPLRTNVAFFATLANALQAGFRACKRCRPGDVDPRAERSRLAGKACRLLEADRPGHQSAEVARTLGLSAAYFQRWFRSEVGVTPQAYRRRVLAERAKEELPRASSVLEAALTAGYETAGSFYASGATELGMSAREARSGGSGRTVSYAIRASSLGRVLVAWTERGLCSLALGDTDAEVIAELGERYPAARRARAEHPTWVEEVLAALDRPRRPALPYDIQGTAFQERVWRALMAIPWGETRTYAEVARSLGEPKSARAVARAIATNRLAVLIPCHRVVRGDGQLGGYRWGVPRKRTLLDREAATAAR